MPFLCLMNGIRDQRHRRMRLRNACARASATTGALGHGCRAVCLTVRAQAVELELWCDDEPVLLRDKLLQFLDVFVFELDDGLAARADEVVVVITPDGCFVPSAHRQRGPREPQSVSSFIVR